MERTLAEEMGISKEASNELKDRWLKLTVNSDEKEQRSDSSVLREILDMADSIPTKELLTLTYKVGQAMVFLSTTPSEYMKLYLNLNRTRMEHLERGE